MLLRLATRGLDHEDALEQEFRNKGLVVINVITTPRGLSFLIDRNRLTVAVSRAETLCVVVGHPLLAVTPVNTVADLKRVNFVAALMEVCAN
jgi:hypothetical protein